MKTTKILLFILCNITTNLFSQSHISSGNVSGTWTLLNSPYYIEGEITIPDDSTLIIEPGVLVEFQGHYALNVQGQLLAIGTQSNNITFTIKDTTGFHDADTTLGGWYGIRFIDLPNDNDTSKIIYCNLLYGKAVGTDWFWNAGGAICILHFDKVLISNCTIKNCSAGGSGFAVGGALAVGWSDIQLIDNVFTDNTADVGGAVHFYESDPNLINNIFENNSATNAGALDIQWKSHPIISNNQFINNKASETGGAIGIGGDSVLATFNDCLISGNIANFGGAINAWTCELKINDCSIIDNSSSYNGGGINSGYSIIEINNTNFERDTSTVFGGAMEIFHSEANIDNCNLSHNGAGTRGGAMHSDSSKINILNSNFESDTVTIFGGAIAIGTTELGLNNCAIIDNTAGIHGGGIHSDFSKITLDNISFEGDSTGNSGGGIFAWQCDLNIDNSDFNNNTARYSGGGIYTDSSTTTIDNSSFEKNAAIDNGGAIFFNASVTSINNTSFKQNSAVWGGGILSGYGGLNLSDCSFNENSSEHGGAINFGFGDAKFNNVSFIKNSGIWGGSISAANCDLYIDSCLFSQNTVTSEAGAIEYFVDSTIFGRNYKFTLRETDFIKNSATTRSGAVRIEQTKTDSSLVDLVVDSCQFSGNHSYAHGSLRVAGYIEDFVVSNCLFSGNTAERNTSGPGFMGNAKGEVYNCVFYSNYSLFIDSTKSAQGASLQTEAEVDFINCTFTDTSSATGYAVSGRRGTKANLTNCILWGCGNQPIVLNTTAAGPGCTVSINYCDIENGKDSLSVSDSLSVINWGDGNIAEEPLFVDLDNADLHLKDSSPCIGAGIDNKEINGIWFYCPTTDIEGNPRPYPPGSMPDIGAYESEGPVGIEDYNKSLPVQYVLYQNYPNPFNPITKIGFEIPERGNVRLSIFNILGEEVNLLLNEEKEAGYHSINFNASALCGLPSGVYFYQLKAGNPESSSGQVFIDTKKMILMK